MIPRFRAWDDWRKRMSVVDRIYIDTKGVRLYDDFGEYWRDFSDVILMQSTGLKDKNGKEIFEGDILEIQGVVTVVKFGRYRYLEPLNRGIHAFDVMYDGLGFYVKVLNTIAPDDISPFEPETLKDGEIIGNIYENTELLEVE